MHVRYLLYKVSYCSSSLLAGLYSVGHITLAISVNQFPSHLREQLEGYAYPFHHSDIPRILLASVLKLPLSIIPFNSFYITSRLTIG
jgi:hypothetical protein